MKKIVFPPMGGAIKQSTLTRDYRPPAAQAKGQEFADVELVKKVALKFALYPILQIAEPCCWFRLDYCPREESNLGCHGHDATS